MHIRFTCKLAKRFDWETKFYYLGLVAEALIGRKKLEHGRGKFPILSF